MVRPPSIESPLPYVEHRCTLKIRLVANGSPAACSIPYTESLKGRSSTLVLGSITVQWICLKDRNRFMEHYVPVFQNFKVRSLNFTVPGTTLQTIDSICMGHFNITAGESSFSLTGRSNSLVLNVCPQLGISGELNVHLAADQPIRIPVGRL